MPSLFATPPTADDITVFTQELSWMIGAGVPLGRAIDLLAGEAAQSRLQPVVQRRRARHRRQHRRTQRRTFTPALQLRQLLRQQFFGLEPLPCRMAAVFQLAQ
jgi:type II secretory pathway component PulF